MGNDIQLSVIVQFMTQNLILTTLFMEGRRSGNYEASIWDDDYVQSLASPYTAKEYLEQAEELKKQVKLIMDETEDQLDQLELIDTLQRLDISHHFDDGVRKILEKIYLTEKSHDTQMNNDLYATALKFRILRQHRYPIPQEVFCSFMDEEGNFNSGVSSDDIKGIMALYEASFLCMEGESILDMARDFSTKYLTERVNHITERNLAEQVKHALELPLHWRVQKLEAKWFINLYAMKFKPNLTVLELSKLEFNITQAKYQDEIKQISRWYKETGLAEKLTFARHRLVECFLWTVGFIPEHNLGYHRKIIIKVAILITIMDDMYDVYGTLDELQLFTDAIERWDINALDFLPDYMRIFFLALFNWTNELAYDILRDQGFNIISNLRKLWAELSTTYYLEARWYHSGYLPSLDEYLNTAWISISGPMILFHGYFIMANPINKSELRSLQQNDGIIRWPSMVLRLADDLGTTSEEIKRGDVQKSIQCYMNESGCSEDEAREFVKRLIGVTWKKMNKEILMESPVKDLVSPAMNLARISLSFYQYGDGYGIPNRETKKKLVSLVVEPFQV